MKNVFILMLLSLCSTVALAQSMIPIPPSVRVYNLTGYNSLAFDKCLVPGGRYCPTDPNIPLFIYQNKPVKIAFPYDRSITYLGDGEGDDCTITFTSKAKPQVSVTSEGNIKCYYHASHNVVDIQDKTIS